MGRPSDFTEALADEICDRIAGGESMVSICKDDHMPARFTIFRWLYKHKEFSANYARAREAWADAQFEEMMHIADTPVRGERIKSGPNGVEITTGDMVDRAKLQVDARKWALARMNHKRFGDKVQQEITNPDGSLNVPTDLDAAAKRLEAIQRRVAQRKQEAKKDAGSLDDLC